MMNNSNPMPRRDLRQAQPLAESAAAYLHLAKMTKGEGESLDFFASFLRQGKKEEAAQNVVMNNSNPMPRRDLR